MTRSRALAAVVGAMSLALAACGGSCASCSKDDTAGSPSSAASASPSASASVVAEILPRCRGDAQRIPIPGDDVVVGDVAIGPSGLLVGVVRDRDGKRVASVMRVSLDLSASTMIDVGPALGDDPPPSPRWNGTSAMALYLGRGAVDAGTPELRGSIGSHVRTLRIAKIEDKAIGKVEATIIQQADESTAFDVAWNEAGAALVAWDEDAPLKEDASAHPSTEEGRGFVKVQIASTDANAPRRVASPESSDAELPRVIARGGGGFWLAWLARRAEDEAYSVEGAGEKRAFRWVEAVMLDAKGDAVGPVRRVSSEKGRAAAFDLARSGSDLIVMVQDEAAPSEGAGARISRFVVSGDGKVTSSGDVVDGGVGHSLAEVVSLAEPNEPSRWLAWFDVTERAHLTPLGAGLVATARPSSEPSLDGARVLAGTLPDGIYALVGAAPADSPPGSPGAPGNAAAHPHPELRRFSCK